MKKLFPIIAFLAATLGVFAQAPSPYPILVDSQRDTVAAIQVFQANAVTFRASFKSGSVANSIVAESPFMYWQPFGATNATVVTAQWSIVSAPSGVVDFAFTPASLNYAAGTYTYQIGLEQSGGPLVIKQGTFKINPSAASIGAEPVIFATTNINWGNINWTGLPDYEYRTNTIAVSNSLSAQIVSTSNALNSRITSEVGTLNSSIGTASNALNSRITSEVSTLNSTINTASNSLQTQINAIEEADMWSKYAATQAVNMAQNYATNMGGIDFDASPSGAIQPARMQWKSSRSTLELGLDANVNLDMGQQLMLYAKSIETNQINKGEVVFVAGASGDNPTIKRASNASETLSARTIGITAENIASNNNGFVVTRGTIYNVNTTNFVAGANLYLGANGTMQTNLPQAPLHGVFIGVVERVGQNNGQIFVAVQNYQELEELSDVRVSNPQNNDLLAWNTASNRWQNTTLTDLGILSGLLTNEFDPVFVAASNSFYPRSNPSNFLTTATLSGYATGTPLYVETDPTAVTNVTASGRITATPSGKQVALTFDASGLATGTPIYSVAGLATGTPLYVEADPIWTAASSLYYTISAADAKFATGSPIYSVAGLATGTPLYAESDPVWTAASTNYYTITQANGLFATGTPIYSVAGLATGTPLYAFTELDPVFTAVSNAIQTNIAARLASNVWASADSTTNYALRTTFNTATNSLTTNVQARLASNVWAAADSTTNYVLRSGTTATAGMRFNASSTASTVLTLTNSGSISTGLRVDIPSSSTFLDLNAGTNDEYTVTDTLFNFHGNILTNAGNIFGNAAGLTNFPALLVTTNNLTAIAGSGLGVVSNTLVVTNAFATTNQLAAYLPLAGGTITGDLTFSGDSLDITGLDTISTTAEGTTYQINVFEGSFEGPWQFVQQPIIPGYVATNGSAFGLTNFPSSILTVSAGNANYWRITTAPTGATASGSSGQMAVSGTNLYIYSPDALGVGTARWLRVNAEANW